MPDITTKCFISYHRPDNADYLGVVDRLKSEIGSRFSAQTGRSLQMFLDRDSIGWGADWREQIRASVLGATFFMPVITMRFFQSDACREELSAFYENARELGVTQLIVPIVLAGSKRITADHPDELVRLVERLNYIPIENEWANGYESPAWIGAINRMIENLSGYLEAAETSLTAREADLSDEPENDSQADEGGADLDALNAAVGVIGESLAAATESMGAFTGVMNEVTEEVNAETSPTAKRAKQVRGAVRIKLFAEDFAAKAAVMERGVATTDVQLRAVISELHDIDNDASRAHLEALTTPLSDFPSQIPTQAVIDDAIASLRVASLGNVSTRRALEPAVRGMQSMRAGMGTARLWGSL